MINSFEEAVETFDAARMAYRDGEYRMALGMFSELAHFVNSSRAKSEIPAEQLDPLRVDVRRAIAGYQSCDDEFAWERASGLHDLFPQD